MSFRFRMELGIGFDELVDDQSEFKSRDRCVRCVRPVKVCLCQHIGFVYSFVTSSMFTFP